MNWQTSLRLSLVVLAVLGMSPPGYGEDLVATALNTTKLFSGTDGKDYDLKVTLKANERIVVAGASSGAGDAQVIPNKGPAAGPGDVKIGAVTHLPGDAVYIVWGTYDGAGVGPGIGGGNEKKPSYWVNQYVTDALSPPFVIIEVNDSGNGDNYVAPGPKGGKVSVALVNGSTGATYVVTLELLRDRNLTGRISLPGDNGVVTLRGRASIGVFDVDGMESGDCYLAVKSVTSSIPAQSVGIPDPVMVTVGYNTDVVLGPTTVPGGTRYLYRVYYDNPLPVGETREWGVRITDPDPGSGQVTIVDHRQGNEGGRIFYEATAQFANEASVSVVRFIRTPANGNPIIRESQDIVAVKVEVKTNDEDTFIREGANRDPSYHYAWARFNVKKEAPQGIWVVQHKPGYEWHYFRYNDRMKDVRHGMFGVTASALPNQGKVAVQASAEVELTVPAGKGELLRDIQCGFIQHTSEDVAASVSEYIVDPQANPPATQVSFVVVPYEYPVDWLPDGHPDRGKRRPTFVDKLLDYGPEDPSLPGELTEEQLTDQRGYANASKKETNGWPWYNTPWTPTNGDDTNSIMTMSDSPSDSIPVPTSAKQPGNWPPGPPPAGINGNVWLNAARKGFYDVRVCSRTQQRFFESQWLYWKYAEATWIVDWNFLQAPAGSTITVGNQGKFASVAAVATVPVHVVYSTKNVNCPFGRWLPEVP